MTRFGVNVIAADLDQSRERTPRESILLEEFTNAITYLNQSLPHEKKIQYRAWDMSRASKRSISHFDTLLDLIMSH